MIRAILHAFWGELNTPSSFRADPYGALTNQAGHVAFGAFIAAAICLIYGAWFGEMPYRWPTWVCVTFAYLLLVEWRQQGWKGADSLIDGGFVSLGAAAPLVALKEVSAHPKVILEPQTDEGLAILGAIVVALSAYVYPRALRWWRERKAIGQ
jgi:hypothetical protein